jgi:hypothetical protein
MMNFLKTKKEVWVKPFSEQVSKRVAKIPTSELENWIDQTIYEVGRCMSSYGKRREQVYLDEALKGAEALHAVVDELHKRSTGL